MMNCWSGVVVVVGVLLLLLHNVGVVEGFAPPTTLHNNRIVRNNNAALLWVPPPSTTIAETTTRCIGRGSSSTELFFFRRLFGRFRRRQEGQEIEDDDDDDTEEPEGEQPPPQEQDDDDDDSATTTELALDKQDDQDATIDTNDEEDEESLSSSNEESPSKGSIFPRSRPEPEDVAVCVIGGGVAGLTAAATVASDLCDSNRVVLLESEQEVGGRVRSDVVDGFVLDRGFAVFIDQYPAAQKVLDLKALGLRPFLPGALVTCPDDQTTTTTLARVSDPFRQPADLFTALVAPVGSLVDKLRVLPLLFHTVSKTPEELFAEDETTTMEALRNRWGFGNDMIGKFYKPFLEGIYLAPLDQQSSRMFHFVFKMFSEGSATLPTGGIGAVAQQLRQKAQLHNVDVRVGKPVASLVQQDNDDDDDKGTTSYLIETTDKNDAPIRAKTVIVATDGRVAQKLVAGLDGFHEMENEPEQPQQAVGCLYYALNEPPPVTDPILILNGNAANSATTHPINNVCFPSVVNPSYAPSPDQHLCSVTCLKPVMENLYQNDGEEEALDAAVRAQLQTWFPSANIDGWKLLETYYIPNAQPGQLGGPVPANVYGGRDCTKYRDQPLPDGLVLCGDHMASATLHGALESGVNAGKTIANQLS